jgi:Asp-tRNA(Asn)/Glu-tRNA(Gln) amidotransferase A subunit family amidase
MQLKIRSSTFNDCAKMSAIDLFTPEPRMSQDDRTLLQRRQLLAGMMAAAGGATVAGCSPRAEPGNPIWAGFDERITERTLAEAEKLLGLQFTEAERRLMLGGQAVEGEEGFFSQRSAQTRRWRSIDKENGLAPSTVFDPRLPGVEYAEQADSVTLFAQPVAELPASKEDLAFASLKQLAHWMESGQLTSTELTGFYLDRIARYDGQLQSFITITSDLALQQAAAADRERQAGLVRGPLHGIPYSLKDLADTAGIATTWGAAPYRERVPDADAAVTRLLREAGAVLLGKTAPGALAWGEVWFGGETRNPWNLAEGASGSSAGSAAATAAGLCAFSIGTETWGSIASPSERCGVAGLRPTFGRVSRAGVMALCWSLDKIGPICRYAEDTALVLAALNGHDPSDAGSLAHGFAYDGNQPLSSLTVGYDPRMLEAPETSASDRAAFDVLKASGVKLVEQEFPDLPWGIINPILDVESAAAFENLTLSGRDDELRRQGFDAWPNFFRISHFTSAVTLIQCDRIRRLIMEQLHSFFAQSDVFFAHSSDEINALTNLSGHPELALRAGFEQQASRAINGITKADTSGPKQAVPDSIHLWSSLFQEGKLVRLGRVLEEALPTQSRPLA